MAKSNSQLDNRKEALDQYYQAETIYLELGSTYYALFCRTNRLFEYLNDFDFSAMEYLFRDLKLLLARYDYRYLQALVLLAEAVVYHEKLELSKALTLVDLSIKLLPNGAPKKAFQDINARKCILLLNLGRIREAQQFYLTHLKNTRIQNLELLLNQESVTEKEETQSDIDPSLNKSNEREEIFFSVLYSVNDSNLKDEQQLNCSISSTWTGFVSPNWTALESLYF